MTTTGTWYPPTAGTGGFLTNPPFAMSDPVNSPPHYTYGAIETIEILVDAASVAPDAVVGMLQSQCLKYLLRMWRKGQPLQDAQKAQWYLNRLINQLESRLRLSRLSSQPEQQP